MVDALSLEHDERIPFILKNLPIVFYTMEGANFVYQRTHEKRGIQVITID